MNLASYIDHTLLKPEATPDDIHRLCREALHNGFYGVCVNSSYAALAHETLEIGVSRDMGISDDSGILDIPKVVVVVGFPLGATLTEAKAAETIVAVDTGADEIDTVIPVGRLLAGDEDYVRRDIETVVDAAEGCPVKVIIETGLLDEARKIRACQLAVEAGATFVKTCTGFAPGSATVEDVRLMVATVAGKCQVKASGGIRDRATALALIEAGATRLGTSSSIAIVSGGTSVQGY